MATARARTVPPADRGAPRARGGTRAPRRPRAARDPRTAGAAGRSRPATRGPAALVLVAFAALGAAGLFHTWLRVEGLREAYRLSHVQGRHQTLLRENERLRLEVATLKAPARIERLARTRLGMVPPRDVVVIHEPTAAPRPAAPAEPEPARPQGLLGFLRREAGDGS